MIKQEFHYNKAFPLESGKQLQGLKITYHISEPSPAKGKEVIWICHALTANSDPSQWWPGMVGPGKLFDPEKYTIICANILGSCYGSTGPASSMPGAERPWMKDFPLITIRDMVNCHKLLRKHLGIEKVHTVTGGSVGGFQALEWALSEPKIIENLVLIATGARATPWAIAINETKRMTLEADGSFNGKTAGGGKAGLAAARAVGLLSYRGYEAYNLTQKEEDEDKTDGFRASSYQRYQGDKLVRRFNPYSYYTLIKAHDTHNVARGRGSLEKALEKIRSRTLCIGIVSDLLFPVKEQQEIAGMVPGGTYVEIGSAYGHDGFLLENRQISDAVKRFYKQENISQKETNS